MAKTLKITANDQIKVVDVDFKRMEEIRREIGGYGERVCTQKLQDYFGPGAMMIVDEEGLLKGLPMNPLGSFFYGTARHGQPLVGDFILAILEQGDWTAPNEKQVEEWKAKMERDFRLKE